MKIYSLLIILVVGTFTNLATMPWFVLAQTDPTIQENLSTTAQQEAPKITVKIRVSQGGGSGVLLAKHGNTYLVLTNAHVVNEQTGATITTPDGQSHVAQRVKNTGVGKFDLALLEFNSTRSYELAKLDNFQKPELSIRQPVFSAGFPYDASGLKLLDGKITQLPQEAFVNGTQVGYVTQGDALQGMSGGPVLDSFGSLVGINSTLARPIIDNYVYADGRKAPPDKVAEYREANWSVPMYNLLTRLNPDILRSYERLPRLQPVITPTGYMAELDRKARSVTVRIEYDSGNGSGVIIAKEGNTYYALTAKHVVKKIHSTLKLITPDQQIHEIIPNKINYLARTDMAVVKFTSSKTYDVAQIGDYRLRGKIVFAGGWPAPKIINSQQWQWQLNPGTFQGREGQGDGDVTLQLRDSKSFSNGYDIIYSSITYAGMSGGPIFDTDGRVIGIHGQTEGDRFENINGNSLGNSIGISIQTFLRSTNQLGINSQKLHISTNLSEENLGFADLKSLLELFHSSYVIPRENASADQWIEYGTQLFRTERYRDAVKAFEQAIIRRPSSINAYIGKSLAFANINRDYSAALEAINRAIELVPLIDQPKFHYLWRMRSLALKKLKRYEEALVAINNAVVLDQHNILSLADKGYLLLTVKRYPEAIIVYNQIIAEGEKIGEEQKYFWAYVGRGEAKSLMNDKKGAIADFNIAININPEHTNSYGARGSTKLSMGDYEGAIADLNIAIKNPENTKAYGYRGLAKLGMGNYEAAIADFDIAIKEPENARIYFGRGTAKFLQIIKLSEEGRNARESFESHRNQARYYQEISLVRKKIEVKLAEAKKDMMDAASLYLIENNQEAYKSTIEILKTWPKDKIK
jgi:S1-C subfamily serine protease/tetratricopeptide (TPR) repeat protein